MCYCIVHVLLYCTCTCTIHIPRLPHPTPHPHTHTSFTLHPQPHFSYSPPPPNHTSFPLTPENTVEGTAAARVRAKCQTHLGAPHAAERLLRCWGSGAGLSHSETKDAIGRVVEEYVVSRDVEESARCLQAMAVPWFHHELVKQVRGGCTHMHTHHGPYTHHGTHTHHCIHTNHCTHTHIIVHTHHSTHTHHCTHTSFYTHTSLYTHTHIIVHTHHLSLSPPQKKQALHRAMANPSDQQPMVSLLHALASSGCISELQLVKGFQRVVNQLGDTSLDMPDAQGRFAELVDMAKRQGWLDESFSAVQGIVEVVVWMGFKCKHMQAPMQVPMQAPTQAQFPFFPPTITQFPLFSRTITHIHTHNHPPPPYPPHRGTSSTRCMSQHQGV